MDFPMNLIRRGWNFEGVRAIRRLVNHFRAHDAIYSRDYYERHVESTTRLSAEIIVPSIVRRFKPSSVLDVGCGTGLMLAKFKDLGISRHLGLEYSEAGLDYCRMRGINVRKFDLESEDSVCNERFDLTISMEVAEHLPERAADAYVHLLANSANVVVMTAAVPGQGGTDHVNEQPKSYWIEKFRCNRFSQDNITEERLAIEWRESGKVSNWYHENLLIFKKSDFGN